MGFMIFELFQQKSFHRIFSFGGFYEKSFNRIRLQKDFNYIFFIFRKDLILQIFEIYAPNLMVF